MKPCSSNYANVSRRHKDGPNYANESPLSIRSRTSVAGKGDAPVIAECARISSICAVVPLSTISMSWLVPSSFRLSFKPSLDFLTDALVDKNDHGDERICRGALVDDALPRSEKF